MPAKQKSPPLRDAETGKIVRRRENAPPGAGWLLAGGLVYLQGLVGLDGRGGEAVVLPPGGEGRGHGEARGHQLFQLAALKVWHFYGHPADLGFPDGRMHPAGGHLEQFQIKLEHCGGFLDGIGRRKPAAVQFREFLLNGRKIIVHSIQHRRRKSPLSSSILENGFLPSQVGFCLVWVSFGLRFSLRYVCIVPHTVGSALAMRPHPVGISCHSMPQRLRAFSRFCSHLR